MFIVCFGNGLGNQMFQYAFYLALKKKYPETEIRMDINFTQHQDHNGFELDRIFDVKPIKAKKIDCFKLSKKVIRKGPAFALLRRVLKVYSLFRCNTTYFRPEDDTVFYDEVFKIPKDKNMLFDGVWVNEEYFSCVSKEIISAFRFNIKLNRKNQEYYRRIVSCNSVSIHIRRGDYLKYSSFYILPLEYYKRAIALISSKEKNIKLFIFSDDPDFVENQFDSSEDFDIVTGNTGYDSYIDMFLMSCCKHNIIANSTFSFWGAFLNQNKGKVVVAPNKLKKGCEAGVYLKEWNIIDIDELV